MIERTIYLRCTTTYHSAQRLMCKANRIPEAGRCSATSPLWGTSTTIKGAFCFHRLAIIFACSCGFTFFAHAEKAWIRPTSGLWRVGTNWSGGTPPDITSFIQITNDSTKVVTIDAATPASNLTVQRLSISAPNAATNTLLVADLGAGNPLRLQDTLTILAGGALPHQTTVTEQYLLDLEREAFLKLCGERKTLERIQHTLKTGKPLRN